ncbi:DUF6629 family protein [Streptomyces sp. NPDC051020]|uniref:DUF6629 family protein n=1 Tax=Streptomyces sp. NPDC051020 TaxID=3155409 RepID=UPI00341FD1A9
MATVGSLLLFDDRLLGVLVALGAGVCAALWRLESVSTWCAPKCRSTIAVVSVPRGRMPYW